MAVESQGSNRLYDGLEPWALATASRESLIAQIHSFVSEEMTGPADDNSMIPAGYAWLTQFLQHDLTVDLSSASTAGRGREARPHSPGMRLDSVYGCGPQRQPYLYDTSRADHRGFPGYFLIGTGDNRHEPDLVRNRLGRALVSDMRNDGNLILSQLQLCFLLLHNRVLEAVVGAPGPASEQHFRDAQRIVRWFYQYVAWNDLVRRYVMPTVFERVLERRAGLFHYGSVFEWGDTSCVPLEFRLAAGMTWLATLREGYLINASSDHANSAWPLVAPVGSDSFDLRGFRRLPSNSTVQWDLFVDAPDSTQRPQASRRFGPHVATAATAWEKQWESPLTQAARILLASHDLGLPAGSAVARAMGHTPLPVDRGSPADCLWAYLLLEAEQTGGNTLGPVGSELFAGVIGGMLYRDVLGYVRCDPGWTPAREPALASMMSREGSDWTLAELVAASGAPVNATEIDTLLAGSAHSP